MSFAIRAAVDGCGTHPPGWHPNWPPSTSNVELATHSATTALEPGDDLCPKPHPRPWSESLGQADYRVLNALGVSGDSAASNPAAQDKSGNFEIQGLMSDYNEASTTLASIQKSLHDAGNATIGKL
jgi:hypothetical protein